MSLISCYARQFSRIRPPKCLSPRRQTVQAMRLSSQESRRYSNDGGRTPAFDLEVAEQEKLRGKVDQRMWDEYRTSFDAPRATFEFKKCIPSSLVGTTVTAVGFLGKLKNLGAGMTFVTLEGGNGPEQVQILARAEFNDHARRALRQIKPNSAVCVTGTLHWKYEAHDKKDLGTPEEGTEFLHDLEIRLQSVKSLNTFSRALHLGSMLDPKDRDLHIRFDKELRQRLKFRSDVAAFARQELADFQEVETPILFKSTPEGAREFLVPTRNTGMAYGLPQSPQQYKQILMACGVNRYVQFAKCFRDEDHRADRQPEFTQIDLEMAWADGEAVMQRVEKFVKVLWGEFAGRGTIASSLPDTPFVRMTYDEAMSKHGLDKPDLRIPGEVHRIERIIPADLRSMLTSAENPIVEAFKITLDGDSKTVQRFIREFMDSADAEPFKQNVDGAPGIFVFDRRRPLEGLQAFGFEGAENLKAVYTEGDAFGDGDLLLVQARPDLPHTGGSTMMGKLRFAIYKAAVAQKLVAPDRAHRFLWVTDFPMFTPDNSSEPGQGGSSGFSATHHPFTAPKTSDDLDLLLTDPLKAKADHYDLVLNGVELGGGSRRIHSSAIQKFIMKDILKMPPQRMDDFKHLFRALEAGCPPHAGLAIGFDRLIAVMQGRDSVRDVIAFPKNSNGEDPMVESPSPMHEKQLEAYHLKVVRRDKLEFLGEKHEVKDLKLRGRQNEEQGVRKRKGEELVKSPIIDGENHLRRYLDHLTVLPCDRTETTVEAPKLIYENHMKQYMEHLKVLPRDQTSIIPWIESPKSAILIGEPIDIANNSQQIALAIRKLEKQLQSPAAVMVDDLDTVKSDIAHLAKPTLKSLLQNWDTVGGGHIMLHEMSGMVGESILIGLRLEKGTEGDFNTEKSMSGLSSEKGDGGAKGGGPAKIRDTAEERPSDPGNLLDVTQTSR